MNDFDFANLTNLQRRNLLRQIELAKHAWLDACFKKLTDDGLIPSWIYQSAHSPDSTSHDRLQVAQWLKLNGFRIIDNWSADRLGCVLLKGDAVIHEIRFKLSSASLLPSQGNITDSQAVNGSPDAGSKADDDSDSDSFSL